MSRTHELREGMRVKVVAPDPAYDDVRHKVLTLIEWYDDGERIVWYVDYDGKPADECYAVWGEDIAPLAPPTIIEGVVDSYGGIGAYVEIDKVDVIDVLAKMNGKRVRVTIEVLSPESDGEPRE